MDISNVQQSIEQLYTPTMGVTINYESTTTEPHLRTAALAWGGGGRLNAFYMYQIFALDSAVVEEQEMVSSQVSPLCKNVPSLCKNISSLCMTECDEYM